MNCDICKKNDPHHIFILPLHQSDGKLDTLACEECALKSMAYCKTHTRPHTGFMDGSTACIWCIEEMVELYRNKAPLIRDDLWAALPQNQVDSLNEAAEMSAEVMNSSESVAVLRFLASKAIRTNQSVDEVIHQITESGHYDINYILR